MTKRDSETDIRKLLPDLKTIMKHADPAYSERIYREAMDNPELDAAIAERDRALAEMDARAAAGESTPANDASAAPGAGATRVSAPSPWAKVATGDAIDRSALPSASVPKLETPAVAPPVTSPVRPAKADEARLNRRFRLPRWMFLCIAGLTLSPLAMWAVVSMLPPRHPPDMPLAGPAPSGQATAPVVVDSGTEPSLNGLAPAPSVPTAPSAAAPPTVTSAPSVTAPPNKRHREPNPRGRGDDPHIKSGSPAPPKTVESATPPAPPPAPQPPPPKPEAID